MDGKDIKQAALDAHKKLGGKISVENKDQLDSISKLHLYYTPGVGAVSSFLAKHPTETPSYTGTNNSVAIVSDGSSVLGLGNIGPSAALPVMEGKAMLFKQFADINAWPIVLNTQDPQEVVSVVKAIAPSFGAINLEDIAAPNCFKVEYGLKKALKMPIMHDDQHGTAIVVLAGLINSLKVVGKKLSECKVVVIGAGAAGSATAKLLAKYSEPEILVADSTGIITKTRNDLNADKTYLSSITNQNNISGDIATAMEGADVVIGVSRPNMIKPEYIKTMRKNPIIFALANPDPEILPDKAIGAGAAIVATGRSDFPNQVNNALAFPGIFRGALDNKVDKISSKHKIAAAEAIADLVKKVDAQNIIPSVFEPLLVPTIANVIR